MLCYDSFRSLHFITISVFSKVACSCFNFKYRFSSEQHCEITLCPDERLHAGLLWIRDYFLPTVAVCLRKNKLLCIWIRALNSRCVICSPRKALQHNQTSLHNQLLTRLTATRLLSSDTQRHAGGHVPDLLGLGGKLSLLRRVQKTSEPK